MKEKLHSEKFLNSSEDCAWLREVHLPPAPDFQSFLMWGNEDCPQMVKLYKGKDPNFKDKGTTYVNNPDGGQMLRKFSKKL